MENAELDVNTEPMNQTDAPHVQISGSENCLPVGTRLSEFELTGIIGEGGFGSVYLAFDHSLQRTVAIKEYMPGALAGRNSDKSVLVRSERHQETFKTGLRSFINEARLLAQFDHPALIKVHRFWEQNNTAYMAMRYYEGQTLKNVVKNHPDMVTEAWLRSMLKPILEALEALYKVNILHRDISPDNIMIQHTGGAVLLDFGAARQIIGDMTQALTVILKPGYAPVEQYADDASMKQGPWTDIYALSAVLYAAIAKKPPPTSVARMIKDPIELLSTTKYPNFSEAFLSAINKGLAVNPETRPQSIDEFRRLLDLGADFDPAATVKMAAPKSVTPTEIATPTINPNPAPARAAPTQPPIAQTAQVEVSKPPADTNNAFAETVVMRAPNVSPQTEIKREPAKPPKEQKEKKEQKSKASDEKAPTAGSPAPKARVGKRGLLVAGLLVVIGLAGLGGFLYFNPGASTSTTNSTQAPPAAVAPPIPPIEATPPPQPAVDEEAIAWEDLKGMNRPTADSIGDLAYFVGKHPSGKFTGAANEKLSALIKEAVKLREAGLVFNASTDQLIDPNQAMDESTSGSIALTVKPWGNIFVDDTPKGASPPLKKLRLPEGKHHIKIVNTNFPDYVIDIDVSKTKTVNIEHDFTAR